MALDAFKNFAKSTVSIGYAAGTTSIVLTTGGAAKFASTPFNAVWWNSTDYSDPSDDPYVEVVRVTDITGETVTITRAQEGTSATAKNISGKTYTLIAPLTAKTLNEELFQWRGTWQNDITYEPRDAVTANGSSWVCRATSLDNQPPNGAYWDVLALAAQATNWRFSNLSAYIGTTDPITLPVTSGQSVIQGSEFVFLDTGFLIRNEDYSTDGPTITPLYAYEGRRLYARYQETA